MSNLNINDTYQGGGDFLKAVDLNKRRVNLTIAGAELKTMKNGENKIVLHFENTEKLLVLNKTNARMIADLLNNDDASRWTGSAITLRPDKTQLQDGRTVDCIRVDIELPAQTNQNSLGARAIAGNPAIAQTPAQAVGAATVPAGAMAGGGQPFGQSPVVAGATDDDVPF